MTLEEFLAGSYLERADVVLTRDRGHFFSWLIRWALRSHFGHAALVYQVPHRSPEYDEVFAIEAGESGVRIRHLRDYCRRRGAVVAIKRVRRPWFTPERQAEVSGEALDLIEARYDFGKAVALGLSSVRWWLLGLSQVIQGPRKALKRYRKAGYRPPSQLICSGLVQFGFIEAVSELVAKGRLPAPSFADVVFVEECAKFLPADWAALAEAEQRDIVTEFKSAFKEELEGITPNHLALSPRLDWVYVIRGDLVYPAPTPEEAFAILRWRPKHGR
jgi:hypothetical protein